MSIRRHEDNVCHNGGRSEPYELDDSLVPDKIGDEILVSDRIVDAELRYEPEASDKDNCQVAGTCSRETISSHHLKRRHTAFSTDSTDGKLQNAYNPTTQAPTSSLTNSSKPKPTRRVPQSFKARHILLGTWRHSSVPINDQKHAVIGFIDVSGRLRVCVKPYTKDGKSLTDYPLPPGPGKNLLTFERIIFSNHLIGLNYLEIKEYTRIRSQAVPEESESLHEAAKIAAASEAARRVRENPDLAGKKKPHAYAYGLELPDHLWNLHDSDPRSGLQGWSPLNHAATPKFASDSAPFVPHQIAAACKDQASTDDAVYDTLAQNKSHTGQTLAGTKGEWFVGEYSSPGAKESQAQYREGNIKRHLPSFVWQEHIGYVQSQEYQPDCTFSSLGSVVTGAKAAETTATRGAQIQADIFSGRQSHAVIVPVCTASPGAGMGFTNASRDPRAHRLHQSPSSGSQSMQGYPSDSKYLAARSNTKGNSGQISVIPSTKFARDAISQNRTDRNTIGKQQPISTPMVFHMLERQLQQEMAKVIPHESECITEMRTLGYTKW
ncbi:hypothetical protein QQS21_000169 [Conoideocrella luteorostrata]|uniref:Uncharacterized protein n=1 Tax=Conoideocrella luteorostrata TaxID=1105319 RepID=A0AAJ0G2N5_9HYPO|nr:hypothetical protein QQS21_000169 [Conoideocrella luteorostrata]